MPRQKKRPTAPATRFRPKTVRTERSDATNVAEVPFANMVSLCDALQRWRNSSGADSRTVRLDQLWRNWDMAMGKHIAPVAHPLGHREGILIIGAEDNFLLQELSYAAPEILERANAFMGEELFLKVDLQLLMGKTPLNRIQTADYPSLPRPRRPEPLGTLMGLFSPSSPVARSYAAYVNLFDQLEKESGTR